MLIQIYFCYEPVCELAPCHHSTRAPDYSGQAEIRAHISLREVAQEIKTAVVGPGKASRVPK